LVIARRGRGVFEMIKQFAEGDSMFRFYVLCFLVFEWQGCFKDGAKSSFIWREALIGPVAAKLFVFRTPYEHSGEMGADETIGTG
jgi:hypothetical protein